MNILIFIYFIEYFLLNEKIKFFYGFFSSFFSKETLESLRDAISLVSDDYIISTNEQN